MEELKNRLGIGEHETTPDGKYSLVTEECLACCDHGPCMLINEKLHKRVAPEDVGRILADQNNDALSITRSDLFDAPPEEQEVAAPTEAETVGVVAELAGTSDVQEMKESD